MLPKKLGNSIIRDVKNYYKKRNIQVKLNSKEYFLDGDESQESSAYFNSVNLIHVSTKDRDMDEWLLNLLHETSHADQMLENSHLWQNSFKNGIDIGDIAQLWIDRHIELDSIQNIRIFLSLATLELDAESRTVKKISQYKLNKYVDIKHYIKQAHAYAASYLFAADPQVRQWIPAHKPAYKITELVEAMPSEFEFSSLLNYYTQYRKLFIDYYPELTHYQLTYL